MDFLQIGFTKKTHGVDGEIKMFIEERFEDIFLEKDRIFLEIRGIKQPFFIEYVRGGGEFIVKLEDVINREDALLLQSKGIFLPASEVPADIGPAEPALEYAGIAGFILIDQTTGEIGVVKEVLEMPQQEMAVVHYLGRDVWVPLNAAFVKKIDAAGRTVTVDLPEGLLEL